MEVLQEFPQAYAVEIAWDGDKASFSERALRWITGEDFIGKASLTQQLQFIDNGINHLFLKVIVINVGTAKPHQAGESLLDVLSIAMVTAFQLVLENLGLVYVE